MSEHPQVESIRVYRDAAGEWRWSGFAANRREVADSGEGYRNHGDALGAATSLFPDAIVEDEPEQ